MKKFDVLRLNLFDSTNASFKMALEVQFTRGNQNEGYRDLVYISNRGTGVLNSNIYLTLAYKDDEQKAVYTSYPQLFKLRKLTSEIKDLIVDESGFTEINGGLIVKPEYAEPFVLSNIGQKNNWIALRLCVINNDENGIAHKEPGVNIELSTSNGNKSILTGDEFLTIYTILQDINLSSIQVNTALGFLSCDPVMTSNPNMGGYNQQAQYGYNQPYQQQYNNYQQPAVPRAPQAPRYNNSNYSRPQRAQNTRYTQPAPEPATSDTPLMQPRTQQSQMQPRSASSPTMNFKAIEETPILDINYDDDAAFDSIFNEQ